MMLMLCGLFWMPQQAWTQPVDNLVWEQTNGPVGGTITALAVDARSGYWFAGTQQGLYRSANQGASWERTDLQHQSVTDILIDSGTGVLYVGTKSNGLYRSTDDGASWRRLGSGLLTGDVRVGMDGRGRVLAASFVRHPQTRVITSSIHRSADRGQTWERLAFPDSVAVDAVHDRLDVG